MSETLSEHHSYLSDTRRIERFRQAMAVAVRTGETVADLGCGFGILGLIALEAGAGTVWGIDRTDAIEIARETMARAGLGERYLCLRESSFRAELPEPVDMIVCDHVGYFGLDYGIVAMLADARRRLLRPGGAVMPRRIRLVLAGVSSQACRDKTGAWDGEGLAAYGWLRDYAVNTRHPLDFAPEDIVTDAAVLGEVDLAADVADYLTFKVELQASRDTAIDGLAGWFECELADGVWMTNSPLAPDRIDRHQAFLPLSEAIAARAGDSIAASFAIRHADDLLAWSLRDPASGRVQRQSTWQTRILDRNALEASADAICRLSRTGEARGQVAALVDGKRTGREIEQAVLARHPRLFPSEDEILRFVRAELARITR